MPEHFITLAKAIELTKRYRDNRETVIKTQYAGQDILPLSDTVPKTAIQTLISKPGCVSLRIYYGMDSSLKVKPIVVAVNSAGEDILPQSGGQPILDSDEDIVDDFVRCPTICPPDSPLNQP